MPETCVVDKPRMRADNRDMDALDETAARLEALGNPTRLGVYRRLVRAGDEGLSVGAIQERTGIPASTLSHHMKHLESAGLIIRRRVGTVHICSANYQTMDEILKFLTSECCVDAPSSGTGRQPSRGG